MFVIQLKKDLVTKYSLGFHCFIFVLSSVSLVIYQVLQSLLIKRYNKYFFVFTFSDSYVGFQQLEYHSTLYEILDISSPLLF